MRAYHILLCRDASLGTVGPWRIEFGDHDRDAVVYERAEYRSKYRASNLKIIKCANARQSTVIAAVSALNREA